MSHLYEMNIFIYILLFHFISNEERYFIKYEDTKYEFTLSDTDVSINFLNELKEKKTIIVDKLQYSSGNYFHGDLQFNDTIYDNSNRGLQAKKGEIIFLKSYLKYTFYFFVEDFSLQTSKVNRFARIGNIINLGDIDYLINSFTNSNSKPKSLEIQFEGEKNEAPKEENEAPKETITPKKNKARKKRKKSRNWKTVESLKRNKGLRRYRIIKRLKKLRQ